MVALSIQTGLSCTRSGMCHINKSIHGSSPSCFQLRHKSELCLSAFNEKHSEWLESLELLITPDHLYKRTLVTGRVGQTASLCALLSWIGDIQFRSPCIHVYSPVRYTKEQFELYQHESIHLMSICIYCLILAHTSSV